MDRTFDRFFFFLVCFQFLVFLLCNRMSFFETNTGLTKEKNRFERERENAEKS